MKNLKTLFAILAIGLLSAFNTPELTEELISTEEKIKEQIMTLLGSEVCLKVEKDENLKISFVLNDESEIVLLKVDTDKKVLNNFIEEKLDYKNLKVKEAIKGEIYKISLDLKKI